MNMACDAILCQKAMSERESEYGMWHMIVDAPGHGKGCQEAMQEREGGHCEEGDTYCLSWRLTPPGRSEDDDQSVCVCGRVQNFPALHPP